MASQDNKQSAAADANRDAAANQNASGSTATVSVACKLGNGLIIDLDGRSYTLQGSNSDEAIAGYGITEGIPEDFYKQWSEQYKDLPAVKQGLIFANTRRESVVSQARQQKDLKTGLEPIDPAKPGMGVQPADKKDS